MNRRDINVRYLGARMRGMLSETKEVSMVLDGIQNDLAQVKAQVSELVSRPRVHGMDIYIQEEKPEVAEDYVWINTDINEL
ncbi:MAG TPA: hypothetical protein GXX77_04095 [Candidatus Cloacimonetes bacterium]|nr:hypothetical protein [Candidatus Cloacimonadota bacterium]